MFPLWRDNTATHANATPGLVNHLGRDVTPPDIFAYIAAVCAHPAYTEWFKRVSPHTPGLRIPLTADHNLWSQAVKVGRRVIWAHTFGKGYVDANDNRPPGHLRVPDGPRLISETGEGTHNLRVLYDPEKKRLCIGNGVFSNVESAVFGYKILKTTVIDSWFSYRPNGPQSKSPLNSINPAGWRAEWDIQLLDILNALTVLVDLEPAQSELLTAIINGPQITAQDLESAGVLPAPKEATKKPKFPKRTTSGQTALIISP